MKPGICFCLLFFSLFSSLWGQNDFIETRAPIGDLCISRDKQTGWYVSENKVFQVDLQDFRVSDSVELHKNQLLTQVEFFDAEETMLKVQSQNAEPRRRMYQLEFPQDSTYFLRVDSLKVFHSSPGNIITTNIKASGAYALGVNHYQAWTDSLGIRYNFSRKGSLGAFDKDAQGIIELPASGIIQDIKLTNNDRLAVAYSVKESSTSGILLELRSFPDLQVLTTHFLESETLDGIGLLVSEDDGSLILSSSNHTSTDYHFFSLPDLKKVADFPQSFTHRPWIEEGKVWRMQEGEIVLRDMAAGEELVKIWNLLTPFWSISGFEIYDEENLLLYGEGSPHPENYDRKQGLYRYNLKDNALYSDIAPSLTEVRLFDPGEMKLQDNRLMLSNDYTTTTSVAATPEKLLVSNGNRVQVWDSKKQKKLEEWLLDNPSRNFLSKDGKRLLYFEENKGKTFHEFEVGVVDLSTGQAKKRRFTEIEDFSPVNSACQCFEETAATWICAGGYLETGIWRIDLEELEVKKLADFDDPQYDFTSITHFQQIPGTSDFLFHLEKKNYQAEGEVRTAPGIFSLEDHSFTTLNVPADLSAYFPISKDELMYQVGSQVFKSHLATGKSTPIYEVEGYELSEMLRLPDGSYAVFESNTPSEDFLGIPVTASDLSQAFHLPYTTRYFAPGAEGIVTISSNTIHTYFPEYDLQIPWNEGETIFVDNTSLSVAPNGKILFDKNLLIDLHSLEIKPIFDLKRASRLLPDGRLFVVKEERYSSKTPYFSFQLFGAEDYSVLEWESERFPLGLYSPDSFFTSADGRYVVAICPLRYQEKGFFLVDTHKGEVYQKELENLPTEALFSPDGQFLYVSEATGEWGKSNWNVFSTADLQRVQPQLPFTPEAVISEERFLTKDYFRQLQLQSLQDGKVKTERTFYSRSFLTQGGYDGHTKTVYAGNQEGEVLLWKEDVGSPFREIDLGSSEVVAIEQRDHKLFVLLKEGKLGIIDLVSGEELVSLSIFRNEDRLPTLAWLSPEGYMKAGKNDIRKFHFVKEGEAFPLVNYEIFLNRPDFLMDRLGYAAPEVVAIYREAYEKRLTRNGISPDEQLSVENSFSLELSPTTELPRITEKRQLRLEILAPREVEEIKAYINGVPVYSAPAKKKQTLDLILNAGENEISILGLNKEKKASNPLALSVRTTFENTPEIHYFGVGVSTYEDASMNLKYADKDVKKIAATFEASYGERVHIDTLLNTGVTKENLQLLKEKLLRTAVDDIVILSFSGHGLVDENNEFYFATHDVDFDQPQENGFSYTAIHDLLNDIPARRKLLLIDACNSGEIDSSEDLEAVAVNENVKQYLPEGARGSKVVKSKNKKGLQDSFEVMKSLFYDLDRGNGAYIIAAAGGREFAYESGEWDNGVFTYSFLKALQELGSEWSGADKPIKISRLKSYVEKQVLELTKGKQQPTARAENIEWDWELK